MVVVVADVWLLRYIRMEELGRGVHGRVWLCEDNDTKEFFAVKSVNREDRRNKSLKRSQAEAQARARQEAAEQREAEKRRKQNPNASFDEEMQLNDEEHEKAVAAEVSALARKQSKIDERTMMMDEKVKQEIAIMKRIHHPNVVQLREVIDDIRSKKIFMGVLYYPCQRQLTCEVYTMLTVILLRSARVHARRTNRMVAG